MNRYFVKGIYVLIFLFSATISAQSLNDFIKMPSLVAPTPNVASIEKFGNIPINYSTGVPSISIPFWNIKCGPIDWPVSISYHAAGIKVDEIASSVGLGWALSGPGAITRSVMGKPDELYTDRPNYMTVSYVNNYEWLFQLRNGQDDSQRDIYSYNFNGRSGKFIIDQAGEVVMIPYSNLKVTRNSSNSFIVVDEQGTTYTFGKQETVSTDANGALSFYTTSWLLSKVEPLDKSQSIDFSYPNAVTYYQSSYSFSQSIGRSHKECPGPSLQETYAAPTFSRTNSTHDGLSLSRIDFPNGYIVFDYISNRQDVLNTAEGKLASISIFQAGTNKLIKKFTCHQSYFFYRPPNIATDDISQYRLRLDSLMEWSGDLAENKKYKFLYNTTSMVPRGNYGQDSWGFNNGQYSNASLIQSETVDYINFTTYNIGNANRQVDTVQMKACLLNTVIWPTGGKSEYTFDAHQYQSSTTEKVPTIVGAYATGSSPVTNSVTFTYPVTNAINPRLQIHLSRYNFPGATNPTFAKLTDLTTGNIVYNVSNMTPNTDYHYDNVFLFAAGHTYKAEAFVYTSVSNSNLEAQIIAKWDSNTTTLITKKGGGLRIREVKNFTADNILANKDTYQYSYATLLTPDVYSSINYTNIYYNLGCGTNACSPWMSDQCRIYYSASRFPISTVSGSPMLYSQVTKYSIDENGGDIGKSEFNYEVLPDYEIPVGGASWTGMFNPNFINNDWKNNFLKSEWHYKKIASGYQWIQKTENEYVELKSNVTYSLKINPNFQQSGCHGIDAVACASALSFFASPTYTGSKKLSKTTVTNRDDNGNISSSITLNEYEASTHDFVTKTKKINSKGDTLLYTYKYPADFAAVGNVYQKMLQQNVVQPVIEQKVWKQNNLLSTFQTTYKDWKNDSKIIQSDTLKASLYNHAIENRVKYLDYDASGNPLSVSKMNDAPLSYIWDYNNDIAIAEARNALPGEIAYTSFEADGSGNWNISNTTRNNTVSITGGKSFTLNNDTLKKTGLVIGKGYVITYWSRNGAYNIIGGSAANRTGRTINGWTLYEHRITATSTTIGVKGNGVIDELRLFPDGSQMTTFTYDPLVGITTQNDVNNVISFYEYDHFYRLKNIKDAEGSILKNVQYHYKSDQTQ